MNRGFSEHAASKKHLACYSSWKEKIKRPKTGKQITSLVNTEAIKRNRYYFSTLIDPVAFLTTHQLAVRGKIVAFENEGEEKDGL